MADSRGGAAGREPSALGLIAPLLPYIRHDLGCDLEGSCTCGLQAAHDTYKSGFAALRAASPGGEPSGDGGAGQERNVVIPPEMLTLINEYVPEDRRASAVHRWAALRASVPLASGATATDREWCDTCLTFYTVNGCPTCAASGAPAGEPTKGESDAR